MGQNNVADRHEIRWSGRLSATDFCVKLDMEIHVFMTLGYIGYPSVNGYKQEIDMHY